VNYAKQTANKALKTHIFAPFVSTELYKAKRKQSLEV